MNTTLTALKNLSFSAILWLFTFAFVLHELEEWNIMDWYWRNYTNLPPEATHSSARTWIVFICLVWVAWCAAATLPGKPKLAAFVFLPAVALAFQNALQHIYWTFYFQQYAPGVVTAVLLQIPLGLYILARVVQEGYTPLWYIGVWFALIVPGLVQTVKAGNEMTSPIRAIHLLGIRLSGMLSQFTPH